MVVPPPEGLVVKDLLVDVVLVDVGLLDGVSVRVHLSLHHHRGRNHLTEIIAIYIIMIIQICVNILEACLIANECT